MENNHRRKEPKKSWYWVPFVGAILISIISISQMMDMETSKFGILSTFETNDSLKSVGWSVITVLVFILQGINGLYHYKQLKGDDD